MIKQKKQRNYLPEMEVGDKVKSLEIEPKQHFTQPPPRYSEARLVKTLRRVRYWSSVNVCTNIRYDSKTWLCST